VQRFELLDLFLEDPDVVHEGDDTIRCHWTRVQSGGGQQRSDVEGHGALSGIQDEQLTPGESQ
jgi:hypothetical protein